MDWQLLKKHLPKNRGVAILDAAGGTGRIALPLAKMGYRITLCDISPGMLRVAKRKMLKEGLLDNVEILKCDIRKLVFADEVFDFVLCWNGAIDAAEELIRVTKKGGGISFFLVNRFRAATDLFSENPTSALAIARSRLDYICHHEEKHRVVTEGEARKLLEDQGIKVIGVYGVCGWRALLGIPEKILRSRRWDPRFFKQTTEMALRLGEEASVRGLSRHLVLYGQRT